ncbi:MAG: anthranilate synthase component I family protein, partial [Woeseiaceae bacterium]|nr:anthranilate synthase component I family protein [Woeseiaceae bacterium]
MEAPFDIAADLDTPVSAYLKLRDLQPRFLLESVEGGERLARYSFLGFGEALEVRMDDQALHINGQSAARPSDQQEYLDALRSALAQAPRPGPEVDGLPFAGGLVGVSGYDVVRLFERLPRSVDVQSDIPDAAFVAPASLLVFDHLTRRVALLHDGPEGERQALRNEVIRCLRGPVPNGNGAVEISPASASFTEEEFCERVDACKEYIAAGDIYQIVISVLFKGRSNVSPFEVYRALRLLNPSPYMFFLEFGDLKVVGSSPEALVKLNGSTASLRPIAGTLPRGETPQEDRANEAALLADPKEAAEHVMLVDLARNDLGRVASPGSVEVDPYRAIERYSHVMHIVSGVKGELAEGRDQFDLFAASFPAGTLVGAPKVRAMEIIEEMEQVGRG